MLDAFLILGQIPGTDYQLTFTNIIAIYFVAGFTWLALKERDALKARFSNLREQQFKSKLS